MFTGIIKHLGEVKEVSLSQTNARLSIKTKPSFSNANDLGDSIAVDGCCLTLVNKTKTGLMEFDLSAETLKRTVLLKKGDLVHLEDSLKIGDKLGGHFVFGHVDGVTKVVKVKDTKGFVLAKFTYPKGINKKLFALKGSVAIAGVSLTIAKLNKDNFDVHLVPTTIANTKFDPHKELRVNNKFNLEVDYLARYVNS